MDLWPHRHTTPLQTASLRHVNYPWSWWTINIDLWIPGSTAHSLTAITTATFSAHEKMTQHICAYKCLLFKHVQLLI